MALESVSDQLNQRAYSRRRVVGHYDRLQTIFEAERAILDQLRAEIKDKNLLDIGIGGGRTTPFLLQISRDYTGIDYSPRFVELVRKKFNLDSVYCCDAREMSRFADNTFDFALFSGNGIDYIAHQDRLKALREIRRVLKPGAAFAFSTHNRGWKYAGKMLWQRDEKWTVGFLKECLVMLLLLPRHWRMKRYEVHDEEYAILNDIGHRYSLLTYYITIPSQIRQLEKIGFGSVQPYDMKGRPVIDDDQFKWTYYTARVPDKQRQDRVGLP